MRVEGKRVLLCSCGGTMSVDAKSIAGDDSDAPVYELLCRRQLSAFQDALGSGEPLLVGCTQEAPLFTELAEAEGRHVECVNVREHAGWSEDGAAAAPKMAALIAAAAVPLPPTPSISLSSEGRVLVYGCDEQALAAAKKLQAHLEVSVLLVDPPDLIPPLRDDVPIHRGRVDHVSGHLGAFRLTVSACAPWLPSSRDVMRFGDAGRAEIETDLIVDLSGGQPLVTGADHRDGYLRADPKHPAGVAEVLFDAISLVGTFEKPRYIAFDEEICAHSRSGRTGCTRCLDVCPAGAIAPAGDSVALDPYICAGCGNCAAVCPTGAASYADPGANALLDRLRTLLEVYRDRGGTRPHLFVYGQASGETVAALARFGRGLPAACLPLELATAGAFGLEHLLSALAYGAERIVLLLPPTRELERDGFDAAVAVANRIAEGLGLGDGRIEVVVTADPDALDVVLWRSAAPLEMAPASFLPLGGRRSLFRLAVDHLHASVPDAPDAVTLPAGAPFGRTVIDAENCTLCMACVGACPTGALIDNPEKPQLRFLEDACVQCGLCVNTCPEKVIALEPRVAFGSDVRSPLTVKEEEPYHCVSCGKPFGTKSSIERIVAALSEKHWMFQNPEQIERIRMCDDCRVVAQFEAGDAPMAVGARPEVRTTEDYLTGRSNGADDDSGGRS